MPIVTIDWATGRSQEAKTRIAEAITDVMTENTGLGKEDMIVIFNDIPREHLYIGRKCLG